MFKEVLNSEGVEQLSRQEMKSVDGGKSLDSGDTGSCCARRFMLYGIDGDQLCATVSCGHNKKAAQALASGANGGNWCCEGCGTASWL